MAISDPALDYIESQKPSLLDFVFRLTGDRSRAGIIAAEVCDYVHHELMSSWTREEIRVELYAHAFDINSDARRGIERSFFEKYYRNQFSDTKKIALYYPLELFIIELGDYPGLVATLQHRYHFAPAEIARILNRSIEDVDTDIAFIKKSLKTHPKIKLEEAASLPVYDFLQLPDQHPTDISHILSDMKPKKIEWEPRLVGLLILLGFIVGFVMYQASRLLSP
ncbi:MAG: hypothetical protein V4655_06300 [Bdellovibrionota bacterium]